VPHRFITPSAQAGVTLVGMLVSLTIVGILVSQALPAMGGLRERQQLRAVADQFRSDLQELRQRAVTGQRDLRLHVEAACYLIHDGAAGACHCDAKKQEAVCTSPANVLKLQWTPVTLDSNSKRDNTFNAQSGTVTPTGTVRLLSAHYELREIIAITGRVQGCAVGGGFSGMTTCKPS
jgi:type IV fimbrial biogenesis protein FimT